MNQNDFLLDKMVEYLSKYSEVSIAHWLSQELFTWQWYFLVSLCVFPLFLWLKVVDKKRILEILVLGLSVNIMCSLLDQVGISFGLWYYPIRLIPNLPLFFPANYIAFPVTYMLIYQYFPKWKHFIIAIIITAAAYSFIGEPFDVWAKIYVITNWKYMYSFPIYIVMGLICKGTVGWLIKKVQG